MRGVTQHQRLLRSANQHLRLLQQSVALHQFHGIPMCTYQITLRRKENKREETVTFAVERYSPLAETINNMQIYTRIIAHTIRI